MAIIKFVSTDHHLKQMQHHTKEYNAAKRKNQPKVAQDHAERYFEHKDAIERAGTQGEIHKD